MTLRWLEGWEGATTYMTNHARIYDTATGSATAQPGASDANSSALASSDALFVTAPLKGSASDDWVIGMAFRSASASTVEGVGVCSVSMGNDDGEQLRFEFIDANDPLGKPGGNYYKIRVMRGVTELASSVERFETSQSVDEHWVYFEFKMNIHQSTGSFSGQYEYCRKPSRNGGSPTALTWDAANTGLDTQEQSSTGAYIFTLNQDGGGSVVTDDIYVLDADGSKNNDFLGRITIEGQLVQNGGNGDTISWAFTGGAADTGDALRESKTTGDDDSRILSDTLNQVHLATVEPLAVILAASIVGVRQDFIARMDTVGDLDVAHMFRKTTGTPAETEAGTDLNVSSTTYVGSSAVLEDDPNTATDWDVDDLDSYQHGVKNKG